MTTFDDFIKLVVLIAPDKAVKNGDKLGYRFLLGERI